jgi:hypothetical protein
MLFQQFFKGRENEISAHPQESHIISGGGIFRRTGGGDFIANLSFYIILANEVKISVWTIYPLIMYEMGRFLTTVLLPMYAPVPQKSLRSGIEHRLLHGSIF